jgi:hypothetical protein
MMDGFPLLRAIIELNRRLWRYTGMGFGMIANLQKLAFTLIGLGCLTIVGYLFYFLFKYFITSRGIPLLIRIAIPPIIVGFVILCVIVIWDAIKKRRTEHFEGIEDE